LKKKPVDFSNQQKNYNIFIIDRSASMWDMIPRPRYKIIQSEKQNNRLGAVLEICHLYLEQKFYSNAIDDLFSLIIFNQNASVIVNRKSINEFQDFLPSCSDISPEGSTNFDFPLNLALVEHREFLEKNREYKFKFIFLTDGDGDYNQTEIWNYFIEPYFPKNLRIPKFYTLLPDFHFILFGHSKEGKKKLVNMKNHILNCIPKIDKVVLETTVEVYQSTDFLSLERIFLDKIISTIN